MLSYKFEYKDMLYENNSYINQFHAFFHDMIESILLLKCYRLTETENENISNLLIQ